LLPQRAKHYSIRRTFAANVVAVQFSWELVLVGNYIEGSDDETPEVVTKLAEGSNNIRTVIRPKQGMMGWDMRMGLDAARGTYIGVIDGDGQFPPESIIACLLKCELEDLDLTKTYRVIRDDGLYRRLISTVYNALFSLLFGFKVRDINSKPKIIRRDKYELLHLAIGRLVCRCGDNDPGA
jgi:glycosyltransferase involved in cell wall biosynthesis